MIFAEVCDKLVFTGIGSRQSRFGPRGSVPAGAAALDALQKPLESTENAGSTSQTAQGEAETAPSRAF